VNCFITLSHPNTT